MRIRDWSSDGCSADLEMRRGKAERCQHQEEIILGNAQLDMLAGGMLRPLLRRGNLRLVKHVGQLLPTKQSPLVDECAEIGGLGHVRRGGDDAVSQFVARFGEIEQYPPECRLRR